jgi:hypothetical protein
MYLGIVGELSLRPHLGNLMHFKSSFHWSSFTNRVSDTTGFETRDVAKDLDWKR